MNYKHILNKIFPHAILFFAIYISTIPVNFSQNINIVLMLDILIFMFFIQKSTNIINLFFAIIISFISDSMFDVPLGLHGLVFMLAYIIISRNNQHTNIFVFNWIFVIFMVAVYTILKYFTTSGLNIANQSYFLSALFNILIYPPLYFLLSFKSYNKEEDI